jgi:hypothetical protein
MANDHPDDGWGPGIDAHALDRAFAIAHRGMRPHFVYFMLAEASPFDPLVKIGTTTDVHSRKTQVGRELHKAPDWLGDAAGCDFLTVIGYVVGDRELEQQLHRAFASHRAGSEWFWYRDIEGPIDMVLGAYCVCDPCLKADELGMRSSNAS